MTTEEEAAAAELEKKTAAAAESTQAIELELTEDESSKVEASVLEANPGKAKHELEDEIAAKTTERITALQEENKDVIAKAIELKALPENEGKTDEELLAMAQPEEGEGEDAEDLHSKPKAEDKPHPVKTPVFDESFEGIGAKKEEDKVAEGKLDAIPEELRTEVEELRALKEDPVFNAWTEAKKGGDVSFLDLIKQSGVTTDVNSLNPEALYRMSLEEDKQIDPSISEEDIEEKMDEFKDMDKFERAKAIRPIRAQIEANQKGVAKAFSTQVANSAAQRKQVYQQGVAATDKTLAEQYLGKTFFGVTITKEHTNKVLGAVRQKGIGFANADGSLNVSKAIETQLIMDNFQDMLAAAKEYGTKTQTRKDNTRKGRPSKAFTIKSGIPTKAAPNRRAALEKAQKAANMPTVA